MGYYIRIFGKNDPEIHLDKILKSLADEGLEAKLLLADGESAANWTLLDINNKEGVPLIQVERNPVIEGELGKEELEEFREYIKEYKPTSAVKWLDQYFNKVKVIYAFQILNAAFEDENYPILESIKTTIWRQTSGIFQADLEGFSNEDGYHILWQFSDNVTGDYSMAVRNMLGQWVNFRMDLGDQKQREDFWNGKVPKGAVKI